MEFKKTKIRVNYQMKDVILLDSASQVTICKQTHRVYKIFISEGDNCTKSRGEGKSHSHLRCKIAGIKGNHILDEDSISSITSLADVVYSCRKTMDMCFDNSFCARASKGNTFYGSAKDCMRAFNEYSRNSLSRSE